MVYPRTRQRIKILEFFVCRTPLLLSLRILTALRRTVMMFPCKTVGMHAPSYSSHAFCVQKMEESPRTEPTKPGQMTSCTTWYSSTPLRSSRYPSRGLWRKLGSSSCTNHPQHRVSMWLLPRTWWAGSPLSRFFWLVTRLQRSLTCSASARIQASRLAAPTQLLLTEGGSNVYEVNPWLWQFGRGKPRLGGLTIEDTTVRKNAAHDERIKRGLETCRHSKADKA